MTSRMATRGLKLQTPESLLSHTQEERRQVQEAKAKEKEDQKAAATSKASKKKPPQEARCCEKSEDSDFQDLNENEIEVLKKAKEKKRARQLKKKEEKSVVCDGIAELRQTLPTAAISQVTPKRKLRPKTRMKRPRNAMGGLDANWTETVYGNNKAATSKLSLASSNAMTLDIELMDVPGKFNADVGADVMAVEREGKTNKRMKAKTSSKKQKNAQLGNWHNQKLTTMCGPMFFFLTYSNGVVPKKTNSESMGPALKLCELWIEHFGALPHIPKSVVHNSRKIAQGQILTYCSKLGQNAFKFVSKEVEKFDTVEEQQVFVEGLLQNDAFIFETPGPTCSQSLGHFCGLLVVKTFAFHLTWALSSSTDSGHPCGALALSTAAVEHALTMWKAGDTPNCKSARNSEASFSEEWAPNVAKFFGLAGDLKLLKWDEISSAAKTHLLTVPNAGAGPELKKLLKEADGAKAVPVAAMVGDDDPFIVSD
ncbi:hypothetical protein BT96DRAFT_949733 [Gymnopus androsaceus JB14]|uniref:Uncharacterized protein n=1 Tax=Gymnopus androsaceus JB14 TaxID=1447944 RepID=A0A6A4GJN9_9AGAR|nr:hypothetical protein BT96DRAFT_949733 [Gymnopus androsaceus JB14]